MVASAGRRTQPLKNPAQTETKPVETPPRQQVGANDGQQLVDLLKTLAGQVETAWKAATKEPGGAPLVKFLASFTGRDAAPVAQQQENQVKLSERQNQTKDGLGFTVSEPAPKKMEGPHAKKTEGAAAKEREAPAPAAETEPPIVPTADFAETAARVLEAKQDGQATKAEAGALLYSISKELRLARAAGQTPEQITAKVQQLLGEFRIGTALAPDLIAVSEQIGAQLAFIGMTGDSPEAWEKLGLSLLGGKAPDAPKHVHVEKTPTIAEAMAAFEARGGNAQQPPGHPVVGPPGVELPAADGQPPTTETRRTEPRNGGDAGRQVTEQTSKEQKRLEERRRREQARETGGGGGDDHSRLLQDQINVTQQNLENLRRMQDEQNLRDQLARQQEDELRRRR